MKETMRSHFPRAHAYNVPESIQNVNSIGFNCPPYKVPFDVWVNKYLTVWIMPCNHTTHLLFFATMLTFQLRLLWISIMQIDVKSFSGCSASPDGSNHGSNMICSSSWQNCFIFAIPAMLICAVGYTLFIAHEKVFQHFFRKPWMNPKVTSKSRLGMTTSNMRMYTNIEMARKGSCLPELAATASLDQSNRTDIGDSMAPNVLKLENDWKFILMDTVEDGLEVVQKDSYNWRHIPFPSNWTMLDEIDDYPIYTNIKYPFPCIPPFVPKKNPTGVYKIRFDMPIYWANNSIGDEYSIIFHGVESAFFLYLNQNEIGYSQDSRLPASFDITPYLRPKDNVMYVVVCRFSDGSYLEDQDDWWMAGIHRPVEIIRRPRGADIIDLRVQGDMNGHISICVDLRNTVKSRLLRLTLYDDKQVDALNIDFKPGNVIWEFSENIVGKKSRFKASGVISEPKLWSAEFPHLYTITCALYDSSDQTILQVEACRIGFRSIDINDGVLKLNGRPITICGVNRHEHDPDNGKVISIESMKKDIELAKKNNFNAIRTSHYPNSPSFYKLCDFYGIYVCDEANLETHGMMPMGKLACDFAWTTAFVERVIRMVKRDRNHSCVILWSLGNECGRGNNLTLARTKLRELDTSRPIMYEGGGFLYEGSGQSELSDIICPMYSSVDKTIALAKKYKDRPVILCEYSHAMSNSNGNVHLYWKAFWDNRLPRLAGGFIWDMIDQGIRKEDKDKGFYYAYGGDFGEQATDKQFCINGLFSPDREEHPAVYEIRYLQQPIAIEIDDGKSEQKQIYVSSDTQKIQFKLKNRFSFRELDACEWSWNITTSTSINAIYTSNLLSVPLDGRLKLDLKACFMESDCRSWLNMNIFLKGEKRVLAKQQFDLIHRYCTQGEVYVAYPRSLTMSHNHSLEIERGENDTHIWRNRGALEKVKLMTINNSDGQLKGIMIPSIKSKEVIFDVKSNFTRAVTDNDKGGMELLYNMLPKWVGLKARMLTFSKKNYSYWYKWKLAGLDPNNPPRLICMSLQAVIEKGNILIEAKCDVISSICTPLFQQDNSYIIDKSGVINIHCNVVPLSSICKLDTIPRIGCTLKIEKSHYNILYLGRGPLENYCDRKSSSDMGIWPTSPTQMNYDYIVPCENGNVCDCSWVSFTDTKGTGVLIVNQERNKVFHFSALLHDQKEIHNATHSRCLEERKNGDSTILVNLDFLQMGIGGDLSWLPCVYPEYYVKPHSKFGFGFYIIPLSAGDDPIAIANQMCFNL